MFYIWNNAYLHTATHVNRPWERMRSGLLPLIIQLFTKQILREGSQHTMNAFEPLRDSKAMNKIKNW